jgi:hypothetical protein
MLYICIFSNKFDLKQTIRVLHRSIHKKPRMIFPEWIATRGNLLVRVQPCLHEVTDSYKYSEILLKLVKAIKHFIVQTPAVDPTENIEMHSLIIVYIG